MMFWRFFLSILTSEFLFTSKIIRTYTNSKMIAAYTSSAVGSSSPFHSKSTLRFDDNSNAMPSFLKKKQTTNKQKQTNSRCHSSLSLDYMLKYSNYKLARPRCIERLRFGVFLELVLHFNGATVV